MMIQPFHCSARPSEYTVSDGLIPSIHMARIKYIPVIYIFLPVHTYTTILVIFIYSEILLWTIQPISLQ